MSLTTWGAKGANKKEEGTKERIERMEEEAECVRQSFVLEMPGTIVCRLLTVA